jgi:hypothetical protein
MKRSHICILILGAALCRLAAQDGWLGRWEGSMALGDGDLPFTLRVSASGALLDLPVQDLYGYPSAGIAAGESSLNLTWLFGGGQLSMQFTQADGLISGRYRQGEAAGALRLIPSSFQAEPSTELALRAPDGALLPGTLSLPDAYASGDGQQSQERQAGKLPLIILHAGLGAADRDGNNYNVPGRNDALKQLAEALADLGVATYRYDKRGSGQSSWLVAKEEDLSFEAWISDLSEALRFFAADGRFSSIYAFGLNDGAVVAAAAANAVAPIGGLIIACASADSTLDAFSDAVAKAPPEQREAGTRILAELSGSKLVAAVPDFYAASFRPSFQPYLIEAFRYDIKAELARYGGKLLIIQGDMDLQVTLEDFVALANAANDALTHIVPRMNHVLKDVPQDIEENFAAFSDPSYPVSRALAEAIAEFAR